MVAHPPHPTGRIIYYDGNTDTVVDETPILEVPEHMRFVYLKDGDIVPDPDEADEIVPIVAVYRFTTDERNNLVPSQQATWAIIEERDPDGRTVRRTRQFRVPR